MHLHSFLAENPSKKKRFGEKLTNIERGLIGICSRNLKTVQGNVILV